jgi:hypothetical protein
VEADLRRAELEAADREEEAALQSALVALSTQRARERESAERLGALAPAAARSSGPARPGGYGLGGASGGLPPPELVAEVLAARAAETRAASQRPLGAAEGEGVALGAHDEWLRSLRDSADGVLGPQSEPPASAASGAADGADRAIGGSGAPPSLIDL